MPDPGREPVDMADDGAPARQTPSWSRGPIGSEAAADGAVDHRDREGARPGGRGGDGARRKGSFLTELPILILVAFVLAILMKTFLVQAFFIPSSSMEPTLLIDDRVLVNKLSYTFREPRRGEVVVFSERGLDPTDDDTGLIEGMIESVRTGLGLVPPAEKDFIKRIIGLPGESIEMRDGVVLVDGTPIEEAPTVEGGYLSARDPADFGPVTVPEGEFFMMGDNRPASADSRSSLGTIPREDLIGRAFVVIWPVGRLDGLPIWSYEGVPAEAAADGARETSAGVAGEVAA